MNTDTQAWFRTAGRLFLVALATGAVVGGLAVESIAGWVGEYAGAGVLGALVGMPVALATQALTVLGLRAAGPARLSPLSRLSRLSRLEGNRLRAALAAIPALVAVVSSGLLATVGGEWWRLALVWSLPGPLAAAVTWLLLPWCLAPLIPLVPLVPLAGLTAREPSHQQQPG